MKRHFTIFFILFFYTSLFSNEIVIPPDYWNGTHCLENGVPWQVPGSIYKEDENCKPEDKVLEFGSGGSTIFFANRCQHVLSIETDPQWALSVEKRLQQLNLTNVTLICISDQSEIESFVANLDVEDIHILSVDTDVGYNRSAFLNKFLEKGISDNLRMIILDNYGAPHLFLDHYNKEAMDFNSWDVFRYDDDRWCGKGTKIYIRR